MINTPVAPMLMLMLMLMHDDDLFLLYFSSPSIRVLTEWLRVTKQGGLLAFTHKVLLRLMMHLLLLLLSRLLCWPPGWGSRIDWRRKEPGALCTGRLPLSLLCLSARNPYSMHNIVCHP